MHIKHILAISAVSIMLASCGSSSDNVADGGTDGSTGGSTDGSTDGSSSSQLTGNVVNFGFVELDESTVGPSILVAPGANFGRFNGNFPASHLIDDLLPSQDICEVSGGLLDFDIDDIDDIDDISDVDFDSIGAGDVITITSSAGSYAELTKDTFGDLSFYTVDSELPIRGPAPTGLLVDIPGDVYPAFSNVPIPDTPALQLTAPAPNSLVTPTTQISWEAGSNSSTIQIFTSSIDIATNERVSVSCRAVDDGSFSFDSTTQAAMGSNFTGTTGALIVSRVAYTFRQTGSTVLVVSHSVGK